MRRSIVAALAFLAACSNGTPAPRSGGATPASFPFASQTTAVASPDTPAPAPSPERVAVERAGVTRVIDGDTAEMRLASGAVERVRFIGVDTPESTTRHEPYGEEASRFTKAHLNGAVVYLQYDVERRDRYRRLLAYVWLERPSTGDEPEARRGMLNAILVSSGFAQTLTVPPNVRYVDLFRTLQVEARNAGLGLWSVAPQPTAERRNG